MGSSHCLKALDLNKMRQIIPAPSEKTVAHFKQMIKEHEPQTQRPDDFLGASPIKRAVKPKWRPSHEESLRPDGWLGMREDAPKKRSWKFKRVISVNLGENEKPFDSSCHTTSSKSMSTSDDSLQNSFSNSTRTFGEEN